MSASVSKVSLTDRRVAGQGLSWLGLFAISVSIAYATTTAVGAKLASDDAAGGAATQASTGAVARGMTEADASTATGLIASYDLACDAHWIAIAPCHQSAP
jgi:hypothetical protein